LSARPSETVMTDTLTGMSSVADRLTADEYLSRDFPRGTQLIDGIVVLNEPRLRHQRACAVLLIALDAWVRERGHGEATLPLDVRLDDRNVFAPDVLWFAERPPADLAPGARPPDLAVEVSSPSTWRYDSGRKREVHMQHGVRELWLVDTDRRTVLVVTAAAERELGADQELTSELLAGFRLPIASIFG
jgi:Uma2 family endonuclease